MLILRSHSALSPALALTPLKGTLCGLLFSLALLTGCQDSPPPKVSQTSAKANEDETKTSKPAGTTETRAASTTPEPTPMETRLQKLQQTLKEQPDSAWPHMELIRYYLSEEGEVEEAQKVAASLKSLLGDVQLVQTVDTTLETAASRTPLGDDSKADALKALNEAWNLYQREVDGINSADFPDDAADSTEMDAYFAKKERSLRAELEHQFPGICQQAPNVRDLLKEVKVQAAMAKARRQKKTIDDSFLDELAGTFENSTMIARTRLKNAIDSGDLDKASGLAEEYAAKYSTIPSFILYDESLRLAKREKVTERRQGVLRQYQEKIQMADTMLSDCNARR